MEENQQKFKRRPIKNFFIKKDLQSRYISKIVGSGIFTAAITLVILASVYYFKSGSGYFYFMSNDLTQDLERQSILGTILPSLIIAELISILFGVFIGVTSSRKLALPIFKIEQWAEKVASGNFGERITFREKDEFATLTSQCNNLTSTVQTTLGEVSSKLAALEESGIDAGTKEKIAEIRKAIPSS